MKTKWYYISTLTDGGIFGFASLQDCDEGQLYALTLAPLMFHYRDGQLEYLKDITEFESNKKAVRALRKKLERGLVDPTDRGCALTSEQSKHLSAHMNRHFE